MILYFFTRITKKKTFYLIFSLFFLFFIFLISRFLWQEGVVSLRYGEPYLSFPLHNFLVVGAALFILGIFFLTIYVIWYDFRLEKISFNNLSLFYIYYSFVVYEAITFIRIFFFYPYPYLIMLFYLLIPFLISLIKKENDKNL